jgi:hypothetical protein
MEMSEWVKKLLNFPIDREMHQAPRQSPRVTARSHWRKRGPSDRWAGSVGLRLLLVARQVSSSFALFLGFELELPRRNRSDRFGKEV